MEQPLPPRGDSLGRPVVPVRQDSSGSDEITPSGSSDEEGDEVGINVELVPETKGNGYRIERSPEEKASEQRRRRSKR